MTIESERLKAFRYYGGIETTFNNVSCLYGESMAIPSDKGLFSQKTFIAPPIPEFKWLLLGKGERGSECGSFSTLLCDNPDCGKPHHLPKHCRRRACPDCYELWINEEVNKVVARLLSEESLRRNRGKRLAHIALSPEQSSAPCTHAELRALFSEGYDYIKEKGAEGGACIFHAYRTTENAKVRANEAHMHKWAWVRSHDAWRAHVKHAPHMHLITFIDHMKEPEKGEAWVYKTIDYTLLRKAKREKNLKRLIRYLLTHAVTIEGEEDSFHSVRWFGTCSYNKFLTTEEELLLRKGDLREHVCDECGGVLIGLWRWRSRWFFSVVHGDIDEPKYWDDIVKVYEGEPPP
jgi:hypothetical protein